MCECKAPAKHGHVRVRSDGEGHLQFRIYPVVCSQCKRPYMCIDNGETWRAGFIDKVKLSYRFDLGTNESCENGESGSN